MKKKTDKELGYIITDGMIDTIGNKDLTDAQVGLFMRSIVGGNRDYAKNDIIVKALVTAFIEQFKAVNKRRTEMIGRRREGNRERERLRREESSLARQKLDKIDDLCEHMSAHVGTCDNMSAHVRTCGVIKGSKDKYISPYNPPAGDEKHYSAKGEGGAGRGSGRGGRPSTGAGRAQLGHQSYFRHGTGQGTEKTLRSQTTGEDEALQQAKRAETPATPKRSALQQADGTKRPKGGRGDKRQTDSAQPETSGDSRERPASKKTGARTLLGTEGGRCRWTDAEGFCTNEKMQGGGFRCTGCENREPTGADGAAGGGSRGERAGRPFYEAGGTGADGAAPTRPGARTLLGTGGAIEGAAERMMEAHPNSKSGLRAVVRALAAAIDIRDEGGEAEETLRRIEEAHAAWRQTDGWAEDKGQYVQALAAWIRNGGWRKLPPQKKKTAARKGEEMSFGASL